MFVQITSGEDPGIEPDQIVTLWESQNAPAISIPGRELVPTKCHVVGVRFPSTRCSVFLCMMQKGTPTPIYYVPSPLDCDEAQFPVLIQEAVHYSESMGFLMGDLELAHMSRQKAMETVGRLPFLALEQQQVITSQLNVDAVPHAKIPGDLSNEDESLSTVSSAAEVLQWTPEDRLHLARFLADF